MTTAIAVTVALCEMDDPAAAIAAMPSDQLREAVVGFFTLSARSFYITALMVVELERRGDDVSAIALLPDFRLVASGKLSPSAVVRFSCRKNLMDLIGTLPPEHQERLANGEPVEMVVYAPDGSFTSRMEDPLLMTAAQIAQVFTIGKVRNKAHQIAILEAKRTREQVAPLEQTEWFDLDRKRGIAKFRGKRGDEIPLDKLVEAVKALQP